MPRPSKGEVSDEFSVFDTLRDTIYSEVAAVIAGNEGRPHFLVQHLILCSTVLLLLSLGGVVQRTTTVEDRLSSSACPLSHPGLGD